MELTSCPECGIVAEITWRYVEESTDGPVEHVRLGCLDRHWFMGPSSSLLPDGHAAHRSMERRPTDLSR
jgi:hypothetical protein